MKQNYDAHQLPKFSLLSNGEIPNKMTGTQVQHRLAYHRAVLRSVNPSATIRHEQEKNNSGVYLESSSQHDQ